MQTVSFASLSRPQGRPNSHVATRFGDTQSIPANSSQPTPDVEQLRPTDPVDEYEKQAAEEFEKAFLEQQAQTRSFLKGLERGIEVISKNAEWRHQFSEAKAMQGEDKENIFDQLSSLYHLAVARFKEAFPPKDKAEAKDNKAEAPTDKATPAGTRTSQPATQPATQKTQQPQPADATDQQTEQDEAELKPNPEAFKHYQKVLVRYPALALMDKEAIPFDMGKQAALSSKNPDKLMKLVQEKRNTFNKIQQKIRTEIENKQLEGDKAAEFQWEQLKSDPTLKTIRAQLKRQFKDAQ